MGFSQPTGLMAAYEVSSNAGVAVVKICDERRDLRKEKYVGDVFFRRFELDEALRTIAIENERGERFNYSINGGEVHPLENLNP